MPRLKMLLINQTLYWWWDTYRAGSPKVRAGLIAAAVALAVLATLYAPDLLDHVVGE